MELSQEQIAAAQAKLNQEITELEFEDSPNVPLQEEEQIPVGVPEGNSVLFQPTITSRAGLSTQLIAELKEEYKGLVVTGTKDKDGIQVLKNALTRVKGIKTKIEKTREDLKKPVLEAGRALDAEAKKLTAEIDDVLRPLVDLQSKVDKMIDEEKYAVIRAQEKLMNERIVFLKEKGAIMQGVFYCIGDIFSITPDILKTMNQADFENLLKKAENANVLENERKNKEEFAKAALDADREQIDKDKQALLDARISMRESVIRMLGYTNHHIDPEIFYLISDKKNVNVSVTLDHIMQLDDSAFMDYIAENKKLLDQAVKEANEKEEELKKSQELYLKNRQSFIPSMLKLRINLAAFESENINILTIYPIKVKEKKDQLMSLLLAEIEADIELKNDDDLIK